MRFIPEVDIPEPLLKAQDENKLVVFAGAGVSVDPPSNLPSFMKLVHMIETKFEETKRQQESPDKYLGRLEKSGCRVREFVAKVIGDEKSEPNEIHKSLVRLFAMNEDLRIVTTNFDRHFSVSAQHERSIPTGTTALHRGNRVRGVINLHGVITEPLDDWVLTDTDFSEAYVHNGWAREFLIKMFQTYVVLFYGYNHEDPIMYYLSKGLSETAQRFALVPESQDGKWKDVGIHPITYPLLDRDRRHLKAKETMQEWAFYSQLNENEKLQYRKAKGHVARIPIEKVSFIEEEKRISAYDVKEEPPENGRAANYIESILKELPKTRFFVRNATNPEWLDWLDDRGILKPLFDPACKLAETDSMLAGWICASFVGENPDPVFELYHKNGQQLNLEFWRRIVGQLTYSEDRPEPQLLARWISLLLKDVPSDAYRYNSLDYLLSKCRYPEDKYTALLLLDYLLSPTVQTEPSIAVILDKPEGGSRVDVSLKLRGEHICLKESWEKTFRANLNELWRVVLPIVQSHLTMANQVNIIIGKAAGDEDYETWWRSAIEPHEQDRNPRSFDVLIDAARDILEYALKNHPEDGKYLTESWFRSAVPILRRIAIHGISVGQCWAPDEKIMWLLDRGLIFRHWFKHEVFQVIRVALPECSEAVQRKLITRVERGYEY